MSFAPPLVDSPDENEDTSNDLVADLIFGATVGGIVGGAVVGIRLVGRTLLDLLRRREVRNPSRPFVFGVAGGAVGGAGTIIVFNVGKNTTDIEYFKDGTNLTIGIPIAALVAVLSSEYIA